MRPERTGDVSKESVEPVTMWSIGCEFGEGLITRASSVSNIPFLAKCVKSVKELPGAPLRLLPL